MAGGNLLTAATLGTAKLQTEVVLSRAQISEVNRQKAGVNADFAYADYVALTNFFTEMKILQNDLIAGRKLRLRGVSGEVDPNTLAGALVLNVHLQNLQSQRDTLQAFAKLGLKIERDAWKH